MPSPGVLLMTVPSIGGRLGQYHLEELLSTGRGGMVYAATHIPTKRRSALRILPEVLAQNPTFVSRFPYEARAIGLTRDPCLCEIVEFGSTPEGVAYLVMEFLEGKPLSFLTAPANGQPTPQDAIYYARCIARALAAAHAEGVVHGALRPGSIWLQEARAQGATASGLKILGLGLSKLLSYGESPALLRDELRYLAPEQLPGAGPGPLRAASAACDVFALGVILFEMLTGRAPFRGSSVESFRGIHLTSKAPLLVEEDPFIPEDLSNLTARMLSVVPDRRPQMSEVAEHLESLNELGAASMVKGSGKKTGILALIPSTPSKKTPSRATQAWAQVIAEQRAEQRQREVPAKRGFHYIALTAFALLCLGIIGVGFVILRQEPATPGIEPVVRKPPPRKVLEAEPPPAPLSTGEVGVNPPVQVPEVRTEKVKKVKKSKTLKKKMTLKKR